MDLNHGFFKYIVAKVLTLGFEHNIKFCQTSVWAFDKILPRVVLGFLVFVKFCQTNIWAFEHNVIVFAKITFGLCKSGCQNSILGFVKIMPN